jgi:spore coat polysaccharide biosynthesis predicted glycosyltransferase SpsG
MVSPGLSLFEALVLHKPVIAIHQNEIQAKSFKGIPSFHKSEIYLIDNVIQKRNFINPYNEFILALEIGQGKKELTDIFLS